MKRRVLRASIIAFIFGGLSFLGQTQTGGEGLFSDPSQPAQGADLNSTILASAIVWILAYIPWKKIVKHSKK